MLLLCSSYVALIPERTKKHPHLTVKMLQTTFIKETRVVRYFRKQTNTPLAKLHFS